MLAICSLAAFCAVTALWHAWLRKRGRIVRIPLFAKFAIGIIMFRWILAAGESCFELYVDMQTVYATLLLTLVFGTLVLMTGLALLMIVSEGRRIVLGFEEPDPDELD